MHKATGVRDPAAAFPLPGTQDDAQERREANRATCHATSMPEQVGNVVTSGYLRVTGTAANLCSFSLTHFLKRPSWSTRSRAAEKQVSHRNRYARRHTGVKIAAGAACDVLLLGAVEAASETGFARSSWRSPSAERSSPC
jgi:hypothetical protein